MDEFIKKIEEFIFFSRNYFENLVVALNTFLDYQGANLTDLEELLLNLKTEDIKNEK